MLQNLYQNELCISRKETIDFTLLRKELNTDPDLEIVRLVFLTASRYVHLRLIETLLPFVEPGTLSTALHKVIMSDFRSFPERRDDRLACAALLLERGAEPGWCDPVGNTALLLELDRGVPDLRILRLLLQHGADIHAVNRIEEQDALLMVCARKLHSRQELAAFLLKQGARVHQVDLYGRTALTYACIAQQRSYVDEGLVDLLIQAGANTEHRDKKGLRPADYVAMLNDLDTFLDT